MNDGGSISRRVLAAILACALLCALVGRDRAQSLQHGGGAIAFTASKAKVVLTALHESGTFKLVSAVKAQKEVGHAPDPVASASPLFTHCPQARIALSLGSPLLPRSPWVGVVELRI